MNQEMFKKRVRKALAAAVSKDKTRTSLLHVHEANGRAVAADGFRIHLMPSEYKGECAECAERGLTFPDIDAILPKSFCHEATVDANALRRYAQAAVAIEDGTTESLVVTLDGKIRLSIERMTAEIDCEHQGEALEFGLDPEYLVQALRFVAPEDGFISLKASTPNAPIVLEYQKRVAVIAPRYVP